MTDRIVGNALFFLSKHTAAVLLLLFFFLSFLLGGCRNLEKSADEKIEVVQALPLQPSSGLIFVALDQGFFEQAGLRIRVIEYPSGKRALNEGLLSGKADIAVSADVPLVTAALRGESYNIFATIFYADNVNRIIARRDSRITRPEDLKGKRVATQYASAVHFFLDQFMLEKNIGHREYTSVYMKAEDLPGALADGRIDAFSMREPYISTAAELLGNNRIIFSAPGVYRQVEALVAADRLVREQPEVLECYIRALLLAEEFVRKNQQQSQEIIARKLGVEPSAIAAIWPEIGLSVSLEQSSLLLLEQISRWVINIEITENRQVPNFLRFFYQEALRAQKDFAVDIVR